MLARVIEILTGPVLIAQFGVMLISLLWSYLAVDLPTTAILDAVFSGSREFKPLIAK